MRRFLLWGLILLSPLAQAFAEELPFSFYNNQIKLLLSRSQSETDAALRLDVKATGHTSHSVFEASNPSRIVIDFRDAQITRSRSFTLSGSPVLNALRCGVHPNYLRVVLDFKTSTVPPYTIEQHGDWFTLIVKERGSIEESKAGEIEPETAWTLSREQFEFNTHIWNKTDGDFERNAPNEQTWTNHLDVRPEISFNPSASTTALISSRIDYFGEYGNTDEDNVEARVHEGYINYSSKSYNLRVGNQIVTWGKADEISPLDNINPEDLRDGLTRRRSERKIPIPIVHAELLGNEERLQGVFIPFFERSRVDLVDSDWAVLGNQFDSILIDEDKPDNSLSNSEYGARYAANFDGFDMALSFLNTRSDLPSVTGSGLPSGAPPLPSDTNRGEIAALALQNSVPLNIRYPRRQIYGAEIETVYDNLGIRGDFAYVHSDNFVTSSLESIESSTFTGTLGVDYSSPGDFYVNLQYAERFINDFEETYLMSEEVQHSFYSEISQEFWSNHLKFGIRGFVGVPEDQYFYSPYALLSYWDDITFELGAEIVGGDLNTPLGYYRQNDIGYLITRIYF